MLQEQQSKATALYTRLSRDDMLQGESMSIQTQKTMLSQYAKQNGFSNCVFYVDDGYSGTNFERPGFQKMLEDIEAEKIGVVITKDLSRLGRDYLKTGYYIETYFSDRDVRYIAVNDGVDTANHDNNEFMPFKNIINEWYAKDGSRKVRSAYRTKAMNGEFTGPFAPYGYKKSEQDKHKLVPDEKTAWVVKKIFKLAAEGVSPFKISTILKNEQILTPRAYVMDAYGKYVSQTNIKYPYDWGSQTIIQIIQNEVYLGHIVSHKHTTKSFKCKKIIDVPKEDWIVVRNVHEPLVDEHTFRIAQETAKVKRPPNKNKIKNLFSGILKCGTCGSSMSYQSRHGRNATANFACNKYRRYGKEYCSMHYITYEQIYEMVLDNIRYHAKMSNQFDEQYILEFVQRQQINNDDEKIHKEKELIKIKKRITELDTIIQHLYEDNVLGKIADDRFASMSAAYEDEQKILKSRADILKEQVSSYDVHKNNATQFIDIVRNYMNIPELTSAILNELIEKIVVHEREIVNGNKTQRVDIYYRYVGLIES